jgi:hypothetical protein
MINLERFFENQFDDAELSDERMAMFTEVHITRLEGNNPGGKYTALITPTNAKFTVFKTAIADKHFLHSEREGATLNVDNVMDRFKKFASKTEKFINYTFGETSVEYQEFYPHGVTEYTWMTKTNAGELMANMKSACQKHAASLTPAIVSTMENLSRDYDLARQSQLGKSASIEGKQDETSAARAELELQLQVNLLTLALDFIGQPDKCHTYFDTSLLKPYRHTSMEGNGEAGEGEEGNTEEGEVNEGGEGEITPQPLP